MGISTFLGDIAKGTVNILGTGTTSSYWGSCTSTAQGNTITSTFNISLPVQNWQEGLVLNKGDFVRHGNVFYYVTTSHVASSNDIGIGSKLDRFGHDVQYVRLGELNNLIMGATNKTINITATGITNAVNRGQAITGGDLIIGLGAVKSLFKNSESGIVTAKASTTVVAAPTPETVTTVTASQNNVNQLAPTGSASRTTVVELFKPNMGVQLNNAGTARLVTPPTTLNNGNYRQAFRRRT